MDQYCFKNRNRSFDLSFKSLKKVLFFSDFIKKFVTKLIIENAIKHNMTFIFNPVSLT